jgi:hypothetical protein
MINYSAECTPLSFGSVTVKELATSCVIEFYRSTIEVTKDIKAQAVLALTIGEAIPFQVKPKSDVASENQIQCGQSLLAVNDGLAPSIRLQVCLITAQATHWKVLAIWLPQHELADWKPMIQAVPELQDPFVVPNKRSLKFRKTACAIRHAFDVLLNHKVMGFDVKESIIAHKIPPRPQFTRRSLTKKSAGA